VNRSSVNRSSLSWEEVQKANADLDPMTPSSLKSLFRAPSLKEVLAAHWRETIGRLVPSVSDGSSDSSSSSSSSDDSSDDADAPKPPPGLASFEQLWGLMLKVYRASTELEGRDHRAPLQDNGAAVPLYRLAGFSVAASSPLSADPGPGSEAWRQYVHHKASAATSQHDNDGASVHPRPYPGARPLIRFKQTFVLGPTASSASTSAASPNLGGPKGEPASLDTHPDNLGVELRVAVPELRHEVGMSVEAMKRVLAICGSER